MNWITILGIIFVALGTILTIVGQNIVSDRSSRVLKQHIQSLKETVIQKDQRILDCGSGKVHVIDRAEPGRENAEVGMRNAEIRKKELNVEVGMRKAELKK